jgi:hypothetical protein
MNKAVKVVACLPAILFALMGVRWLADPGGAAASLGMPLLEGLGRSTQIGDLSAFFVTASVLILLGVFTGKREWLYAPALLLGSTAIFRTVAWAAHGAAFATSAIVVEVVSTGILLFAASRIKTAH